MPRTKKYENRIPAFYRRSTIDLMLFAHVTAIREYTIKDDQYTIQLGDAINDFFNLYKIPEQEYEIETALSVYTRVQRNFIWSEIKQKRDIGIKRAYAVKRKKNKSFWQRIKQKIKI